MLSGMLAFQQVSPSKCMCNFPSPFELHVHPIEAFNFMLQAVRVSHITRRLH
jgi:hypothetical protein